MGKIKGREGGSWGEGQKGGHKGRRQGGREE